ncbi:HNH endonuclease [uncultured Pseudacidovorax sp.]|uniref:HNH endonuclease n=1 Tax=uncultured Pseudacidovorax sp. TaxID=679313 RepID=UPI0025DC44BE|nr:HNH endonuclease [uncultured Pseudacidovorax sp.]
MTKQLWLPCDLQLLREVYADMSTRAIALTLGRSLTSVYRMAKELGLEKSDAFNTGVLSGRINRGRSDPRLKGHRFKRGDVPWNKGRKGAWVPSEASRATQFKPGAKPVNWMPLGSHRVNSDGYLERKVREGNNGALNWRAVHRIVWEEAFGPVPPRHMVAFKPGRHTTKLEAITVEILECISREENARRNHPRNRDPEYWKLVHLKGQINRQVNRIAREARGEEA